MVGMALTKDIGEINQITFVVVTLLNSVGEFE